jgi:hypothetical protein
VAGAPAAASFSASVGSTPARSAIRRTNSSRWKRSGRPSGAAHVRSSLGRRSAMSSASPVEIRSARVWSVAHATRSASSSETAAPSVTTSMKLR